MTPKPQRGTPDGDATLAIQKLAREADGDVQELQTLYVLEALLARVVASPLRPASSLHITGLVGPDPNRDLSPILERQHMPYPRHPFRRYDGMTSPPQ